MLGLKRKEEEEVRAFLGKGAEFTGKLMFNGSVRIDGDFKGDIFGNGTLVIGEGAEVEADIRVDSVLVSGEVRGQIDVKKKSQDLLTREGARRCEHARLFHRGGGLLRRNLPHDPQRSRGPYPASGAGRGRGKAVTPQGSAGHLTIR